MCKRRTDPFENLRIHKPAWFSLLELILFKRFLYAARLITDRRRQDIKFLCGAQNRALVRDDAVMEPVMKTGRVDTAKNTSALSIVE